MKFKDWVAITKGIDEFDVYDSYCYFSETKDLMMVTHGEREIENIFIEAYEDGSWVVAKVYLK